MTRWTAFAFVCALSLAFAARADKDKDKDKDKHAVPVEVVNSPDHPVPTVVEGTTTVTGTVGLAPGAKVTIDGPIPPSPLDPVVLLAQGQGDKFFSSFNNSTLNGGPGGSFKVPAHYRLVIDSVLISWQVPAGGVLTTAYLVTLSPIPSQPGLVMPLEPKLTGTFTTASASVNYYAHSGPHKIYLDEGEVLQINQGTSPPITTVTVNAVLYGHLIAK